MLSLTFFLILHRRGACMYVIIWGEVSIGTKVLYVVRCPVACYVLCFSVIVKNCDEFNNNNNNDFNLNINSQSKKYTD